MKKTIIVAEGKTATIVSPSQLAINVGEREGVQKGDRVTVRRSVIVTDPDTRSQLGTVHLSRLNLRVTMVHDTFSVAEVIDVRSTESAAASIFAATRVSRYKTITAFASAVDSATVLIEPGEQAIVTRTLQDDEEGADEGA